MNILLIDQFGLCLDFALRCRVAGHDIRWCVGSWKKTGARNPVGDGFGFKRVPDWEGSMRWADLAFIPIDTPWMSKIDVYRRKGFPVYGPSCEVFDWEENRAKGQAVLEEVGVECIPYHTFRRLSEAQSFLASNPARYVFKPNSMEDKATSYVGKSAKDMAFMMGKWEKDSKIKGEFILQEFIPGIEVAVGGWFGPGGFSEYFLENFEHKKLMNGEIGVNTGEMGTVMKYTNRSALAEHFLRPLEGHLYRAEYTGHIDVSAIVAKDGTPYPLEFTCRPGWPLFQIQQSLHPDPVEWMLAALDGQDTFRPSTDVAIGVVMAIPDFPYSHAPQKDICGYPLYGWNEVPERNLHLWETVMGEAPNDKLRVEPIPVTSGDKPLVVSGNGKTVAAAKKAAYRNLDKIELPNSPMYRTDIGDRLAKQLPTLQRHGWCEGWEFGEL
jgi:phosphoribosylamine--glycine ligase